MELLGTVTVDGSEIRFVKVPLDGVLKRDGFHGQKMFHLFDFDKEIVTYTKTWGRGKKKKTEEITKTYLHYKDGYADANAQKTLEDPDAIFEVKFDGGCGSLIYDETEGKYNPYTRRDVKKNNDGVALGEPRYWKERKDTWIPCEPEPTVPEANHWPHMVPCYEEPNSNKWMIQAFENLQKTHVLDNHTKSFTIEWMGQKCNYCKTDPIEDDLAIIAHGSIRIELPASDTIRSYEGMKTLLTQIPFIEGIVCYSQHGVFKVRRDLFWSDTNPKRNMSWGRTPITEFAERCPDFDFANGHGLAHYVKLTHSIQYIPKEMITPELYKKAVENNGEEKK